jgi:hypothetical protein
MNVRASVLLSVCLLLVAATSAQAQAPLTNEDILTMVQAGFGEETIIKAIETNEPAYDTSVQALVELKKVGVSEKIITAMLEAGAKKKGKARLEANPVGTPTTSPGSATAESRDVWPAELAAMPREVGLYYERNGEFIWLYGKPIVATNTGGFLKRSLTMGVSKVRSKGQLPGKRAQLQVFERQPAFYAYMPEGQTPEGFVIVKMETKGNRRVFQVGSSGGLSGGISRGLNVKKVYQIEIERIASRLYRVTPLRELKHGEYGFLGTFTYTTAGLAGAGEKIYDFGIPKER